MNAVTVTRQELKYKISRQEYVLLSTMLKAILKLDPNAKQNGDYFIRSLYFDSPDNLDYMSKDNGVYYRKKLRLRIYDLNQAEVKLEMKSKYGSRLHKQTGTISREDALSLSKGQYDCLLSYDQPAVKTIYKELKTLYARPAVIVDYEREAYVSDFQNIRINFDKNIRACSTTTNIFDPNTNMAPLTDEHTMVLEVKFNELLPDYIRDVLSTCSMGLTTFSKYCIARETV